MKTKIYSLICIAGLFVSCDHFLGVEPKGKVIPHTVEDYEQMLNNPVNFDITNLDLMVPEVEVSDQALSGFDRTVSNGYKWEPYQYLPDENDGNYSKLYQRIYAANEIIAHIDKAESTTLNEALRAQVKGQAYADRARCYWGLVNLYGQPYSEAAKDKPGVALILENSLSQKAGRATVGAVYDRINKDLQIAENLVPEYVVNTEKSKACRQAVLAFRARVWLYMNRLDSAKVAIDKAFEGKVPLLDYNDYVKKEELGKMDSLPWKGNGTRPTQYRLNDEIIWYTPIYHFIFNSYTAIYVTLEQQLLFDKAHDLRYLFDYGTYHPYGGKYESVGYFAQGGYRTYMISGAEMYLLKAEISARSGDYGGAVEALNELRKNRYLNESDYELNASDAATALKYVKEERRREMGCTFLSWFDLRRYQAYGETVPAYTRTVGGKTVTLAPGSNLYTLSIPRYVISKNSNIEQNPR